MRLFKKFLLKIKLKRYCIYNYTINKDLSIDVDGIVFLDHYYFNKIPFKFNNVSGDFRCNNNELTTLENCPKYVGGDFICFDNNLTSLEHCPKYVGGDFICFDNNLTSLEHCPEYIGGYFNCQYNNIQTIEHIRYIRVLIMIIFYLWLDLLVYMIILMLNYGKR